MIRFILIASTAILLPSIQHFVPPLSYCLLADICNHTWVPDCGREDYGSLGDAVRMFIDECDMFEYNCDFDRKYEITNYSECFRPATADCPPMPRPQFLRIGNYKIMERGRQMIYAPTTTNKRTTPVQHLKRRYVPKRKSIPITKQRPTKSCSSCSSDPKKTLKASPTRTPKMKLTKRETVVLKRMSVLRNGKKAIKVVKGFAPTATAKSTIAKDSEFIE